MMLSSIVRKRWWIDDQKKTKLNVLFEEVLAKASIDYSNQEMQDIKTAVRTILQKVVARVNRRGIFNISQIQQYGRTDAGLEI